MAQQQEVPQASNKQGLGLTEEMVRDIRGKQTVWACLGLVLEASISLLKGIGPQGLWLWEECC